ncbi:MAG: hypothetical protein E6471_31585, partial [Bradyrhizobium sp.]|jgi:hypothetical protein|nr:hypothetical protein [Bradyrhizobium sp.]
MILEDRHAEQRKESRILDRLIRYDEPGTREVFTNDAIEAATTSLVHGPTSSRSWSPARHRSASKPRGIWPLV